ncbi:hypothetical protein PT2222_160205 [Paraburkholderia tropica]
MRAAPAEPTIGSVRESSRKLSRSGSIAEVIEVERRIGYVLAQHGDHALQVVALGAGHTHGVALNARLHLDLAVLHEAHDLFREIAGHALLHGDDLLHLVAADFLDLAVVEKTHVHIALGQFRQQHVLDLAELEIVVGERGQLAFLLLDARIRALEVEARGDFLVGLLDRVLHFDHVGFADDVKRWHCFLPKVRVALRGRAAPAFSGGVARTRYNHGPTLFYRRLRVCPRLRGGPGLPRIAGFYRALSGSA